MALVSRLRLDEQGHARIREAIAAVERRTDAELVTVLARRSGRYAYVTTLGAAILALAAPAFVRFTPFWIEPARIVEIQWFVFLVLSLAFQIPPLSRLFVPEKILHARAASFARRQFLAQGVHRTEGHTGVLVFVSEYERYVEILADDGIASRVSADRWDAIVERFVLDVRAGRTVDGFVTCIESCGAILVEHAPATSAKNELPDHLRVIG